MKLKTTILLCSLLLTQTVVIPINASSNEVASLQFQRKGKRVHIEQHREHKRTRSVSLLISGYVEDDMLLLSFNFPLANAQFRVVDAETGKTIFEGAVSGTSLSIPLERDSDNFEVYIN